MARAILRSVLAGAVSVAVLLAVFLSYAAWQLTKVRSDVSGPVWPWNIHYTLFPFAWAFAAVIFITAFLFEFRRWHRRS